MSGGSRSHNPHDGLVRYVFGRPEAAAVVVRRVMPPELVRCIDFDSLEALPTVESDLELRMRVGDLRFKVDVVDGARRMSMILVFEHQSTLEPRLPCRVHVYVGDMWTRFIQDHPRGCTVPAIVPIVLAQHPARNTPTRLADVLDLTPRLKRLLGPTAQLEMYIDDLSGSVLDDPVADPATLALVEVTRALLHAHRNPTVLTPGRIDSLASQFDVLLQRDNPLGEDDVGALWRYVITVFGSDSPLCGMILDAVGRRAKEMFITIADELRAEGRAAGLSEGRAAGRAEALLEVLGHRGVTVSDAVRDRLLAERDPGQLQRWFTRALVATSAEALFEPEGPRSTPRAPLGD